MAKDLTFWQGLTAGVGFQPAAIAKKQRAISTNMADIDIQRTKETEFATRLARAIFDREGRKADEIRREIREWNLANPDYRVIFAPGQIRRRVLELKRSRDEKIIRRTPKEMRQRVAESMREGL